MLKDSIEFESLKSFKSIDYSNVLKFPVFRDTVELIKICLIINQGVNKTYQILLDDVIQSCLKILKGIINAQRNPHKRINYLQACLDNLEYISTLVSLIILFTKIGQNNASRIDILIEQIGRQLNGWKSKQIV